MKMSQLHWKQMTIQEVVLRVTGGVSFPTSRKYIGGTIEALSFS